MGLPAGLRYRWGCFVTILGRWPSLCGVSISLCGMAVKDKEEFDLQISPVRPLFLAYLLFFGTLHNSPLAKLPIAEDCC